MVSDVVVANLVFNADFDSGNVACVNHTRSGFILHTRSDVSGVPNRGSWFHFSVRSSPAAKAKDWLGRVLQFEIHNMNPQIALMQQGHRPVCRALPSAPDWRRVDDLVTYSHDEGDGSFVLRFMHKVTASQSETLYFAFSYPYSYADCMAKLAWLDSIFDRPIAEVALDSRIFQQQQKQQQQQQQELPQASPTNDDQGAAFVAARRAAMGSCAGAFSDWRAAAELAEAAAKGAAALLPHSRPWGCTYWRELLTYSVEGRRIDLLTLSGHTGISGAREPSLDPPLLPDAAPRPNTFPRKRTLLVTSRVHPGETPSSFVVDGLLAFLLREDDPRAVRLRANFVVKIVPFLNPDGVAAGKFRTDTAGENLNRVYRRASQEDHPSVAAALALAASLHARGELYAYIDVHAHAGKRGCFLYGNLDPMRAAHSLPAGHVRVDGAPSGAEHAAAVQEGEAEVGGRVHDDGRSGGGGGSSSSSSGCVGAPRIDDGVLFARLVALNTPYLDLDGCVWYEGVARHGAAGSSGREAVYEATGRRMVYTLECNYNAGKRVNDLPERHVAGISPAQQRALSPPPPQGCSVKRKYDTSTWRDVGKALALAAIDLIGVNPASRAGADPHAGCEALRREITEEWLVAHRSVVSGGEDAAPPVDSEDEEEPTAGSAPAAAA